MPRVGIWRCPECGLHQIWKTRSDKSNKLDRKCSGCGKRVRTTLDRSSTGKGRSRNVEIWERDSKLDAEDLEEEAQRRNIGASEDSSKPIDESPNEDFQTSMPKIWGVG